MDGGRERADFALIVSLDGLRPDALEKADAPHLHALRARGAYSDSARAVTPTKTLLNHCSMISGVGPKKHKVDWNEWEPDRGMVRVPTLFDLAKRYRMRTALFPGKAKLFHLARAGTVDFLGVPDPKAQRVADQAASCIRKHQPQLMLVHFADPDLVGHRSGWLSAEQLEAIRECDRAFGSIVAALQEVGILDRTLILVTADHGGRGHGHGSAEDWDTRIPWLAAGPGIPRGVQLAQPITTYDTAATVAFELGLKVPRKWKWDGKPQP